MSVTPLFTNRDSGLGTRGKSMQSADWPRQQETSIRFIVNARLNGSTESRVPSPESRGYNA